MRPFKVELEATKGVVTDFANEKVPEGFAIESINGRFLPARDGKSFDWISVRGEKNIPITGDWTSTYSFSKGEMFQGNIIAFVYNTISNETYIIKLTPTFDADKTFTQFTAKILVYDQYNISLQISALNPVSKIRFVYDTNSVYTIYWNIRGLNALKSIRIINDLGSTTLTNVNFSQNVKYGTVTFNGLVDGALSGGAMFYAYRLLGKNGAVTDWSMAMGPVMIPNRKASDSRTWDDYCSIRYAESDEKSACGVSLTITGIDTSFYKIQLAAMVSNEDTTFEKGYICIEEKIDPAQTTMVLNHLSDASYGIVLAEDVQISTQSLLGCADFDIINNIMVVISPTVDESLAVNALTDRITTNRVLGATITGQNHKLQFDNNSSSEQNPLSTNPPIGFATTAIQNVAVSKFFNRITNLPETYSIPVPAEYVGYKNPTVATLMRNCWRGETYRLSIIPVNNNGKRLGARYLGDFTMPFRGGLATSANVEIDAEDTVRLIEDEALKYVMNVVSLMVGGIDITQWVNVNELGVAMSCDIQGFHVVVSPRDKRVLHEGALFSAANHVRSDGTTVMTDYGVVLGNIYDTTPSSNTIKSKPVKNLYQYYSPDVQNDLIIVPDSGSYLQIEEQYKGQFSLLLPNEFPQGSLPAGFTWHTVFTPLPGANDSFTPFHYSQGWAKQNSEYKGVRVWNKYFKYLTSADSLSWTRARNAAVHQMNDIDGYYDLPAFNAAVDHAAQAIYIEQLGQKKFINAYWGWIQQTGPSVLDHDAFGSGAACRLIVTKTVEDVNYSFNPYATCFTNGVTVVSSRLNSAELYGGTSDSAIEKSIYRSCWHYQPIDNDILAKVRRNDGKFIFDKVEVFAGDSFIVPYSVDRLSHGINYGTPEHAVPDPGNDHYPTNAFMVPLQSNINWTMSDGDKWEKHRGLKLAITDTHNNDLVTGIGVIKIDKTPAYGRLEHSDYPSLARVVYGQNLYYALPESIFYTSEYPMRFFWSNRKIDAESTDSFRVFPFENYQSIQSDYGLPVAIRAMGENAIIFTENGIGIVPVDERSAVQDASGKQLSIGRNSGVGKYTIIDRVHGLQHFFSLSQKGDDFTWFDSRNRSWLYWGKGQAITDLSEKYKFDSDFQSLFSNPSLFDENLLTVRTMFSDDGEVMFGFAGIRTFVFDLLNNIYQGRRDIELADNLILDSLPVVMNGSEMFVPGHGIQSKVNDQFVPTILTLVCNKEINARKVFDSFVLNGENVKQIILTNDDYVVKTSVVDVLGVDKLLHKFTIVEFTGNRYIGEVPLTDQYDYLRGNYAVVKIIGFPDAVNPVRFSKLILNLRKDID